MKNIIQTAKAAYFNVKFKLTNNDFIFSGQSGDLKKVQDYIDAGVDVNKCCVNGFNLLHDACMSHDCELVSLLLKNKANPNVISKNKDFPLLMIVQNSLAIRQRALSQIVDSYVAQDKKEKESSYLIARDLIDYGAQINIADSQGNTPLLLACFRQNETLVELLIARGADVFAKNKKGNNAFKAAVFYENIGLVTCILKNVKNLHELEKHYKDINHEKDFAKKREIEKIFDSISFQFNLEKSLPVKATGLRAKKI